jgi:hypothetical protein
MHIIQFLNKLNYSSVGIVEEGRVCVLKDIKSSYELFNNQTDPSNLEEVVGKFRSGNYDDYEEIINSNSLLAPLFHPDIRRTWITGTGLTHYGSAYSRDKMHKTNSAINEDKDTDSVKMFEMGEKNGKFMNDVPGIQPEWFYKGNGLMIVNPGQPVSSPSFGMGIGEEPEIAGVYIIDLNGCPRRIGFVLGNEFSDHKMEKINYLYLAHSKLRYCSYGPELVTGDLPAIIEGRSRIIRNNKIHWEKKFLTGE